MGVVLGETAYTGQAVQLTALLVAVHRAEFGQTQRQFLVGAGLRSVDFAVVGAVHRFEEVFLALLRRGDGTEGVRAIFLVVPGGLVQVHIADVRRYHLLVSVAALHLHQEVLKPFAQVGALRQPERQPEADTLREGEQLHLLAYFAVVALLGLLQHVKVFVQLLLFREADCVDSRKLLALFIPAPVGSGKSGQLDRLDRPHVGQVRSAAKVHKAAAGVEGDASVFKILNEFRLIFIPLLFKIGQRVRLGDFRAYNRLFAADDFRHFRLDFRKILRGDGVVHEIDIVVEAGLNARAYAELDTGV